ncbi:S1C family serine protease [Planctomycetota bacterium]
MKAKRITSIVMLVLFSAWTGLFADSDSADARPYLGVLLDSVPLPSLLIKHLGLSPDQGIRIKNVHRGGPADKAGLERDDIIIRFEGEDVVDSEAFVDEIRKAGVGTEVSLQIIHLGKRKPVTLTLETLEGEFDLKYPPEPEIVQSWRPGKIFRLKPGDENWMEVLKDGVPPELDVHINRFFNELHTYHHSDGEDYTITIEGNPNDDDSKITVQAGDNKYETTVGKIDKLPEKYREPAEQAVKSAQKDVKKRKSIIIRPYSWRMPSDWKSYFDKIQPNQNFQIPHFEPGGPIFEKIQKQLEELQRRLDRLEKRREEPRDSHEPKKEESQDRQKPVPLGKGDQESV